jgi:hypothetical protein
MQRSLRNVCFALMAVTLAGCGAGTKDRGGGEGVELGGGGEGPAAGDGSGGGTVTTPGGGGPQPGVLTAGDWDDNLNFGLFQEYLTETRAGSQQLATFEVADRVTISVRDAQGAPVSGARITFSALARPSLSLRTGTDGRTLFMPTIDERTGGGYSVTVDAPSGASFSGPMPEGKDWTFTLDGAPGTGTSSLDLAFLVDATGSMGDEIAYLKTEVQGIADGVRAAVGDAVSVRYALIVYRDVGDDYVTRVFDFTPDLQTFRQSLAAQSAGGGGDWPEAMEQGVRALNGLSWRSGNVARVAFLVADAPPHADRARELLAEVNGARRSGIRVYPVAASGTGGEGEYYLRAAAQLTLAKYLFLTDDSGVGAPHDEPHIPCYRVQKLSRLMVRVVQSEVSGAPVDALPEDIIRSVGNPQNGSCTLQDGTQAFY